MESPGTDAAHPAPPRGNGVYDGVRVLELASGLSAPYATMFLADNGADVVKVEDPGGDPYRSDPGFQTVNRNKRSVVADEAELAALVAAADLIVADGPGRAAGLRAANPGAVIVTVPPWGERGPLVDHDCTPSLLHAATGMAWNQQSYGEVPVHLVVPLAHYATGMLTALAAAAGLYLRDVSGRVATYEVSGVAGAAALQLGEFRPVGDRVERRPGESAMGSKGRVACYRLVEAGDGQWLFLACGTLRFYQRMLEVIGRTDLLDDPDLTNPPWGLLSDEAIARLTPILDEVFATRPRDEWLEILRAADVPAQPVLTREQFLATSIVATNDLHVTVEHPELGPVAMMGIPVSVAGAEGTIRRHAPLLDGDHEAVLADWARPRADPDPSGTAGLAGTSGRGDTTGGGAVVLDGSSPLAGIRVIDLASFIAGPVVSRHLAMLGAEVVKVEPPTGDPFRAIGPMFSSWNQGKRSVAVDLATAEGRDLVAALARRADVVVENFRPGVAERLGVDRDTLAATNPDLVFLSSPGYGLDPVMADRPAFDPLLQALGGLMAAQGGLGLDPGNGRTVGEPVFVTVPIHDVATPLLGAFGVVAGLHRRHRDGGGQLVATSLAHSTMAVQAAELTRFAGRPDPALGGFDHPGPGPDDTWFDDGDGPRWRDGDRTVAVCRVGLTGDPLAEANGLLTTVEHPEAGTLVVFGQLIGGAGPAPGPPPLLDADGDRIRAEAPAAAGGDGNDDEA